MSRARVVQIVCDATTAGGGGCGAAVGGTRTAREARVLARGAGWRVQAPGGRDYCPEHRDQVPRRAGRTPTGVVDVVSPLLAAPASEVGET